MLLPRLRRCAGRRIDPVYSLLVAAMLLIGACAETSDGIDPFAEPASGVADPADGTKTGSEAARRPELLRNRNIETSNLNLSTDEVGGLLEAYGHYLETRDQARLGQGDALVGLAAIAAPPVVARAEAWLDDNDPIDDRGPVVVALTSFPDVLGIAGSGDKATVHDCLEVEVFDSYLNLAHSDFVDQLIMFELVAGKWFVADLQVSHDGDVASGPLGCVPPAHGQRVERSVAEVLAQLEVAWANPAGSRSGLEGLLSEDNRADLDLAMSEMDAAGIVLTAPQEHQIEVLGSDAAAGHRSFVVAVCTFLPEGLPARSAETGELVAGHDSPAEPGSYLYREWEVRTAISDEVSFFDTVGALRHRQLNSDCGSS